jgi:sugar lactone lactonase YvrE
MKIPGQFSTQLNMLDLKTGEKLGEWETGEICYTTPLIVGDRLFCGSGDRNMYVIDLKSMEIVKKIYCRARIYSSPKLVAGNVIYGTNSGEVIEIDPVTLRIRGKFQLADAVSNAVAVSPDQATLYVSTAMNHLFAVERQ